jgi:hypothetical protein
MNDLPGAWRAATAIAVEHPEDQQLLEQMAHLGEWSGETETALDYWIRLLKLRETRKAVSTPGAWRASSSTSTARFHCSPRSWTNGR